VTAFAFDEFGRPTGRTLPAVTGEPTASEFTVYDKLGNVDYTVDFLGNTADRVYDYDDDGKGLGRLVSIRYLAPGVPLSGTPAAVVGYTYDALGRRWSPSPTTTTTPTGGWSRSRRPRGSSTTATTT
jgi:hypothetical protein